MDIIDRLSIIYDLHYSKYINKKKEYVFLILVLYMQVLIILIKKNYYIVYHIKK
jgi:hypothetical protein